MPSVPCRVCDRNSRKVVTTPCCGGSTCLSCAQMHVEAMGQVTEVTCAFSCCLGQGRWRWPWLWSWLPEAVVTRLQEAAAVREGEHERQRMMAEASVHRRYHRELFVRLLPIISWAHNGEYAMRSVQIVPMPYVDCVASLCGAYVGYHRMAMASSFPPKVLVPDVRTGELTVLRPRQAELQVYLDRQCVQYRATFAGYVSALGYEPHGSEQRPAKRWSADLPAAMERMALVLDGRLRGKGMQEWHERKAAHTTWCSKQPKDVAGDENVPQSNVLPSSSGNKDEVVWRKAMCGLYRRRLYRECMYEVVDALLQQHDVKQEERLVEAARCMALVERMCKCAYSKSFEVKEDDVWEMEMCAGIDDDE